MSKRAKDKQEDKNYKFFHVILQHHCRNCGAVVCGPCSSKKFLLAQQSTKPVRVCLDCYDSLSQSKNEQVMCRPDANNLRNYQLNFIDDFSLVEQIER